MALNPMKDNPFAIPELRHQLSRFVTVKVARSCAQVSKSWAATFISVIWFEVDFSIHPGFVSVYPSTIAKYGHHIRVVKNAMTILQVCALSVPSICCLRELHHIETTKSVSQHQNAYEVVSRNMTSLQVLGLYGSNIPQNKRESLAHYVSIPALIPFSGALAPATIKKSMIRSSLKVLTLTDLCLTSDSLMIILRGSPRLTELWLTRTNVYGRPMWPFQHLGLRVLMARIKNIVQAPITDYYYDLEKMESREGPTLLSYFPELRVLKLYDQQPGISESIPNESIKEVLTLFSPHLTTFHLCDTTGAIVPKFCQNTPRHLTEIVFLYRHTSPMIIRAILAHRATLKSVSLIYADDVMEKSRYAVVPVEDEVFREGIQFESQEGFDNEELEGGEGAGGTGSTTSLTIGQLLQLIPQRCVNLEVLSLHLHEMDMDEVESLDKEWVCKGLKTLRVRIKGLDTKKKISGALSLWYYWLLTRIKPESSVRSAEKTITSGKYTSAIPREEHLRGTKVGREGGDSNKERSHGNSNSTERAKTDSDEREGMRTIRDNSIEARVARHLLKFEKLETIWLGYKTWSVL
ncbi:hypothetical protein FBU30_000236 [Linnemannia zychae]|nr:hypothetical protein FBU30_000236 [Linnemannia zychae]